MNHACFAIFGPGSNKPGLFI